MAVLIKISHFLSYDVLLAYARYIFSRFLVGISLYNYSGRIQFLSYKNNVLDTH